MADQGECETCLNLRRLQFKKDNGSLEGFLDVPSPACTPLPSEWTSSITIDFDDGEYEQLKNHHSLLGCSLPIEDWIAKVLTIFVMNEIK